MQALVDHLLGIREATETDKRLSKVRVPNDAFGLRRRPSRASAAALSNCPVLK